MSVLLTKRELSVINEFDEADNHITVVQVASELGISPNTVKAYVSTIKRKLEVESRAEAINKARRLGLLAPGALV